MRTIDRGVLLTFIIVNSFGIRVKYHKHCTMHLRELHRIEEIKIFVVVAAVVTMINDDCVSMC